MKDVKTDKLIFETRYKSKILLSREYNLYNIARNITGNERTRAITIELFLL